jgi:hypothetical protein
VEQQLVGVLGRALVADQGRAAGGFGLGGGEHKQGGQTGQLRP